jgi:organic radical activating enzyme
MHKQFVNKDIDMSEENSKRLSNKFGYTYWDYEYDDLFTTDYPECALMWSHMSNEPGGTVRSCCIATNRVMDDLSNDFNLGTANPVEILRSNHMQRMRNEIRSGQQITNCQTCWIDEANGKESKRQKYNQYYKNWYGNDGIAWSEEGTEFVKLLDMQLIFDNTCNLKCRSCNANYSSKWVEEANDRKIPYWKTESAVDMMDTENSKFWTEFDIWTKDLQRLEIMGGEPFYVKEFRNFVDKLVESGKSRDIDLSLSTNGTIADELFLDKIVQNFKRVSFSVSIDGVEDKFEYLRHPGKWDSVKENLDKFYELHNSEYPVQIQITHTVTALNVMYLPEFYDYFNKHYPTFKIWNNIAHYPKWITASVLTNFAKKHITELLTNHNFNAYQTEIEAVVNYMNTPLYTDGSSVDESLRHKFDKEKLTFFDERSTDKKWEIFKNQIVSGDLYRAENFTEVFPELYALVKDSFDYDSELAEVTENGWTTHSTRDLVQ